MNKKILILFTAIMLLTLTGCNSGSDIAGDVELESTEYDFLNTQYITDIAYLNENLDNDNLLILDARGQDAFDKGHIPNAVPVMWQQFSLVSTAPGDEEWGTVLPPAELSAALSAVGVTADKEIIVYCDTLTGWGEDGRITWMLSMAGHENVKMLDGGFNYWEENNLEISKEDAVITEGNFEVASINTDMTIDTDELSSSYDDYIVIDTRTETEYDGAQKYGEARGGHLPNSINIDFTEFLNENGTYKTQSEIVSILDDKGITTSDKLVSYCTAGIRSGHLAMTLSMTGYNCENYDESFYRWSNVEELQLD